MISRIIGTIKDIIHHERMGREKYKAFFVRLLLLEAVIFTAMIIGLSFLVSSNIRQNEKTKLIQNSRDALAAITSYYDKKHDNFIDILMPMYLDAENYNTTTQFFENSDEVLFEQDPFWRQELVDMLRWVCAHDRDILSLLFYKKSNGRNYIYNAANNSFETLPDSFPFVQQLNKKPAGRLVAAADSFGTNSIEAGMYGIGGTLGTTNLRRDAGNIMVLYDVKALKNEYYKVKPADNALYLILKNNGEVIFSSDSQYYGKKYEFFDSLNTDDSSVKINGMEYYKVVMDRNKRNYLSVLLVPSNKVEEAMLASNIKIYSTAALFVLISAILYFTAGYIISKRVNVLIKATEKVGSHNLGYRIPISGCNDEYEYISKRFNSMCDELQDTINKSYLYEIKQKNAELRELQSCINPHFLYNTLEAIRSQVPNEENPVVNQTILMLARFFRNITKGSTIITIREEIYSCQLYLDLFSLRYQDSLSIEFDVTDDIMEYSIIRNLIQPIIENYMVHGYEQESTCNRIVIEGRSDGDDILLVIKDNGVGMSEERLEYVRSKLSSGTSGDRASYGIQNVNERIKLVYGSQYGISIDSGLNEGTSVSVRLRKVSCEELENWQRKNVHRIDKAPQQDQRGVSQF